MPSSGETSPYSKKTQVVSKRRCLPNLGYANAVKVDGATPNRWRLGYGAMIFNNTWEWLAIDPFQLVYAELNVCKPVLGPFCRYISR